MLGVVYGEAERIEQSALAMMYVYIRNTLRSIP